MSETETKSISEQASVAPTVGTQKRAIQMKMFADDDDKKQVAYDGKSRTLGMIICRVLEVKERTIENKSGDVSVIPECIGEFEATVYKTGEVMESGACYLPKYFCDSIAAQLASPDTHELQCAVEIVLVATGKSIPVAYEVRRVMERAPTNPLEDMKRKLAAAGRLRGLPAPVELPKERAALAVGVEHEPEPEPEPEPEAAADAPKVGGRSKAKEPAEA